jgi:hypothetical protein
MPAYSSLNTQIDAVKAEITTSLAAASYTAQDLVYVAKALETLGNLLGINDLVAATADAQATLNEYLADILDGSAPANVGKLYVGAQAQTFETNAGLQDPAIVASINTPDYAQIAFQNKGGGANSSTDFIAYANNGTDEAGYIDMGITSSNFADPEFTITGPNDGYIFFEAPKVKTASVVTKVLTNNVATLTTSVGHGFLPGQQVTITAVDGVFNGTYTIATTPTTNTFTYSKTNADVSSTAVSPAGVATANTTGKGNLVFATSNNGTENNIIFAAGGLASDNTQMVIIPDQTVHVEIATQSTSPTTGALVVAGGMGVTGNVNVGGNVNITGTITFTGGGTTVETANIAVTDPMIFVADGNTADAVDGAFVVEYADSGTKYSAFFRDASDNDVWKFASNITTRPTNTINTSQAGLAYDIVQAQAFKVTREAQASTELTTKGYVDLTEQNNFVLSLMGAF